jgi:hypothetical protein
VPSAAESCARAETLRRVIEAVVALEEPYRSTVLLRFYDGLPPAEIASAQGVPASTVRTRLQRALERLRRQLDEDERGGRRAWGALLAPLTGAQPSRAGGAAASGAVAVAGGIMAKKAVWASVLVLLLLLGATGWIALRASRDTAPSTAEGLSSAAHAPSLPATGRATQRRGDVPVPVRSDATTPAAPTSGGDERTAAPTRPQSERWRLQGRVLGLDPARGDEATVSITVISSDWRAPPPPPPVREQTKGTFEADVGALVASRDAVELEVAVDDPAFLPASTRVPLATAASSPQGGERTLAVELRLVRAAPLRGRVVDAQGHAVAAAAVGAFPFAGDAPDGRAIDRTTSAADGSFVLRLRPGERHLVAAAHAGFLPATAAVPGSTRDLPPLVLREGVTIAGVVRRNGKPLAGATVVAHPANYDGAELRLGEFTLRGVGDDAFCEEVRATTREDGAYVAAGLPTGPCRVTCGGVAERDVRAERVHADVSQWLERTVEAPAAGVDLAMETSRLVVAVATDGKPLAKASVDIVGTGPEGESCTYGLGTGEDGRTAITVRAGATYDVAADATGFERVGRVVTTAAAGGESVETFELSPERPPPRTLRLTLQGDGAATVAEAGVAAFAAGNAGASEDARWDRVAAKDGVLVVPGAPQGRLRIVVRPGGPWSGNPSTWLEASAEIDVPSQGEASVSVQLREGGRLRIAARDAEGRFVPARCTLRDAAGAKVAARFTLRVPGGGWMGHSGALASEAPTTVEPALPPGDYRVELSSDGFADSAATVRVERGRWTDHEVTLVRR